MVYVSVCVSLEVVGVCLLGLFCGCVWVYVQILCTWEMQACLGVCGVSGGVQVSLWGCGGVCGGDTGVCGWCWRLVGMLGCVGVPGCELTVRCVRRGTWQWCVL